MKNNRFLNRLIFVFFSRKLAALMYTIPTKNIQSILNNNQNHFVVHEILRTIQETCSGGKSATVYENHNRQRLRLFLSIEVKTENYARVVTKCNLEKFQSLRDTT